MITNAGNLKKGEFIRYQNEIWQVQKADFYSPGKGSALMKAKIKNLISGKNIDYTLTEEKLRFYLGEKFGLKGTDAERIEKAVKLNEKTSTKVYVIPIKQVEKSLEVLEELRSNNINSDMDLMDRSISKNLDYANTLSVPYVVFVGEDEVKKKKFKLRDMKSGKEEMLSVSELIKKLK